MGECSLHHPDVANPITGPGRAEKLPQLWSEGAVNWKKGRTDGMWLALKTGKGATGQQMQAGSRHWKKQKKIDSSLESRKECSPKDPVILIQ